jgi:hypothetical protein
MRALVLFLLVVLPGLAAVGVCGYYLFQDWSALITAFARLERATAAGDMRAILAAQAYDGVYRLNAFADGVGVMLGAILFGIGVHGLCLLESRGAVPPPGKSGSTYLKAAIAVGATLLTLWLAGSLIGRVGESNDLRRAILRGDEAGVRRQVARGVDVNDGLWWGSRPLRLARTGAPAVAAPRIIGILKAAGAKE